MGCVGSYDTIEMQGMVKKSASGQKKVTPQGQKAKQKQVQPTERKIKICTINLGKSASPFEYFISEYDEKQKTSSVSADQYELNSVFRRVFRLYKKVKLDEGEQNKTKAKMTSEVHYRTLKRYTPLKNQMAGIKQKQKLLMTKEQFQKKWSQQFKKIEQNREDWSGLSQINQFKEKQELKRNLRQFDLICYHTIVAYVYEVKGLMTIEQINQKYLPYGTDPRAHLNNIVKENLSMKYEAQMEGKFGNPIFHMKEKINRLFYFIDKSGFDILFLQEVPKREFDLIKSKLNAYRLVSSKMCSSAILVSQELTLQLERKQKNLTLHGHNARYLQSNFLSAIKKNQEKNKTVDTFKFQNNDTNLFNKLELIFVENLKKNGTQQEKQANPKEIQRRQLLLNSPLKSQQDQDSQSLIYANIMRQTNFLQKLANQTLRQFKQAQEPMPINKNQIESNDIITRKIASSAHVSNQPNSSKLKKTFSSAFTASGIQQEDEEEVIASQFVKATNSIILAKPGKFNDNKIKDFNSKFQSVCQFIGCLILTSAYVNSRQQMQNLKLTIQKMSRKFPHHTIIVGLSSQLNVKNARKNKIRDLMKIFRKQEEEQLKIYFTPNIYNAIPGFFEDERCSISSRKLRNLVEKKGFFTSYNKKTCFNLSEEEHDLDYVGADNFIISNKKISIEQVKACNNETINQDSTFCKQKRSIPNIDHPFSDFFVCGEIYTDIRQVLQENHETEQNDIGDQLEEEN